MTDATELYLTAARGVHLAASLSAFGVAVFWSVIAPPVLEQADGATSDRIEARLLCLFRVSLFVAVATAVGWLVTAAAIIAEAVTPLESLQAIWPVLTDTRFGHVLGLRIALLTLSALALGTGTNAHRRVIAAGAAGLSLILHGWQAHAAATGGTEGVMLLGAEALHLLAAGAWLGGLIPLLVVVGAVPPMQGARAARRFTPLGLLCVTVLAATALVQGWILIGGLPGLIGTGYGLVAVAKLALFLILLAIAAANRFRHAPALDGPTGADANRRLRRSIGVETAIGLTVVLAAAVLADQAPARHEQPVWPFAWRPSLENINDPDFGPEALGGLIGLVSAALLVGVGAIWRAALPVVLAGAAVIVIWTTPNLQLLLVPAYPTSFYQSPTGFAAATIVRGADLFSKYCVACHGAGGKGDGLAAKSLPVPPADLTAQHLWSHSDGELFWLLSHGIETSRGPLAMPGFTDRLSEEDRWALIDYMHANNAGTTMAATGHWQDAVLAPDFSATCANGRTVTVANLRGQVVWLLASRGDEVTLAPPQISTRLTAIQLSRDPQMRPTAATCVASDPSTWAAYAIVSGVDPNSLDGTQFLVDLQSWLRGRWRPDNPTGRTDPQALQAKIDQILANPLAANGGRGHAHHR